MAIKKSKAKAKANGGTRHRIPNEAKLTAGTHAFREGTLRHKVVSLVKGTITVGTFREKGHKIVGDQIGSFLRDFVKNGAVTLRGNVK